MPEYATKTDEPQWSTETQASPEAQQALGLLFQWNVELASFYGRRCQQYAVLPLSLLSCSSPADMQKAQTKFLQQLAEDYRDQAAKLSTIAGTPQLQSSASTSSTADYAAALKKAQQDAAAIIEQAKLQAERILAAAEARANRRTDWPDEPSRKHA